MKVIVEYVTKDESKIGSDEFVVDNMLKAAYIMFQWLCTMDLTVLRATCVEDNGTRHESYPSAVKGIR